jgi:hypothetical protein
MKRAIERLCRKIQTYWDEREREAERERDERGRMGTRGGGDVKVVYIKVNK